MIATCKKLQRGDDIKLRDGAAQVLLTHPEIQERIAELGRQIAEDYADRTPILVAILRGGFLFQCDLARVAGIPLEVDFLSVSRFDPAAKGKTAVKVLHDLRSEIRGRHLIVVEGIRTGSTKMEYVQTFLQLREPASVSFAALACHENGRNHPVPLQYKGFDVGDTFVIGCGLDYCERYRNIPLIAAFTPAQERPGF